MTATSVSTRRPLYEITADLMALDVLLDECDGDISDPRVEEAIATWATELAQNEGVKLDGAVAYIRQLEMERDAARAQANEWAFRAGVRDRRIERIKSVVMAHMRQTGRSAIGLPSGLKVAIQANGGKPTVQIDEIDPEDISEVFQKEVVTIDRDKVRQYLESGAKLPFARLAERGVHLRIR